MHFFLSLPLAMAGQQGQNSQQSPLGFMGMMLLFFVIMYVMMIRPQQRKEKERKAMLAQLKKGDRVMFAGGLLGTVAQINDKVAKIKVGENLRLEVARGAISAVLGPEDDVTDPEVV